MDVCKCIVPLRHWGTLNSHQGASPLVRLVGGLTTTSHVLSSKLCCHLHDAQSYRNDIHTSSLYALKEFHGPRSDTVKQVAIGTTTAVINFLL
ncbi:hypothetical protein TNCV_54911 [Trichonephila clavipes]|nr:hypothetical protein TNCV_54911 [Trichonephila clavipes]